MASKTSLTLVQVMACCLAAASHHLHQYWFIINHTHNDMSYFSQLSDVFIQESTYAYDVCKMVVIACRTQCIGHCKCMSISAPRWIAIVVADQGLYSLGGRTSYKISWNLEAARLRFRLFQSLWNLTSISAALLPRCLSNFKAIWSY